MADYSSAYNYGAGDKIADAGAMLAPSIGNLMMKSGNPYLMAGGMLVSGLGSYAKGMQQKQSQKELQKLIKDRPIATTPQYAIENKQNAQQVASGALANATNQQALNNINQQGANNLNAMRSSARSSTDLIAGLSGLNQNQNNAFNNLAMQNYGQRMQGFNMLGQANQNLQQYADRNFDYNVNQPYNQAVQSLMAKTQAGNANMNTGLANMTNYGNQMYKMNLADKMYGNSNTGVAQGERNPAYGNPFLPDNGLPTQSSNAGAGNLVINNAQQMPVTLGGGSSNKYSPW